MAELNHELRAKGIGSSEIAMLVLDDEGKPLSRWGGPHKLWRVKTGVELPQDDTERPWLDRGKALEPWILARYAQKTGARLRASPGTVQHREYPYVVDSVDALAWHPGDGKAPSSCVEAKAPLHFQSFEYGEEGTDQIDRQYLIQGQWHMGTWGLPKCDYPIDVGTGDIKIYTSEHDEEMWLALVSIAERFWKDHVESGVPPPVDAKDATSEWLARRLKQADSDIIDADEEIANDLRALRDLRLRKDAIEEEYAKLSNEVKVAIGEHKGICLPGIPKARVTFGEQKGRKTFNHDAYIMELLKRYLPENAAPPDRNEFFKQGAPFRVFRVSSLLKAEV
ncbi:MAG TPA: YqaJ viral recombinase family protein [Thermoleophilia bacterium]|nr:YqaJ viral recombinase family protein [Thermoleophilia bacterium]